MLGRTREESHEIVVGTGVVLTALALGLFLHLRPAGPTSGYELNVRLAKTDGLTKGSEVRISGVRVTVCGAGPRPVRERVQPGQS